MATVTAQPSPLQRIPGRSFYQGVWRLHFIAGLLILPFLVSMATTGSLYLFKDELTRILYRDWIDVPVRTGPTAPLSTVIAKTEQALGGKVAWITPPVAAGKSVSMMVHAGKGRTLTAYADPVDGHLLGSTEFGGAMHVIRKIHSLQRFGFWASCLIEIVAGWTLIMVATGFYLWWPRGQKGGVTRVRGAPSGRLFWRDIHAITGSIAGLGLAFLALTGLTWSLVWGVNAQMWVIRHQLYAPHAPGFTLPEEVLVEFRMPTPKVPPPAEKLPWSMEKMPQPQSTLPRPSGEGAAGGAAPEPAAMDAGEHAAHMAMAGAMGGAAMHMGGPIGIDAAYARFKVLGLPPGFGIALPLGEKGIYAGNYFPQSVRNNRMVFLDQYSGKLLGQTRFQDYFIGGKIIEFGNNVHMGREFGWLSRLLMLFICLSVILLAVSSIVMWWKRRPSGKLGIPPAPADKKVMRTLVLIMAVIGIVFPLTGLSLVVALIVDFLVGRGRHVKTAPA